MPKSKVRKKDSYTPAADRRTPVQAKSVGPSHPIYLVVMFGMMLIGLLWLVVNYLAGPQIPFMRELEAWNFAVGFAFIIVGLLMTMKWR
ncbi:MAG: cell division protein CrgA [Saccharopolyspora sp.]|uniref:cell division protein CrgA n=1 Tax=Saccharopolyspora TaxID=1835 RepID=UPI00190A5FA6|nr:MULTISPECIES: cell division protein CrgA [unclassified Saccharopolyspora]MBK0865324.1 cell division protein CrgA [Saccharopolyspora sp. HNM0986]MBQ6640926.1 cell division protein CrgA [Saccharopolyspora sp.]